MSRQSGHIAAVEKLAEPFILGNEVAAVEKLAEPFILGNEVETEDAKVRFANIYITRQWGHDGRGSGVGSTVQVTELTRSVVRLVMANYSLHSLLDAPCGKTFLPFHATFVAFVVSVSIATSDLSHQC